MGCSVSADPVRQQQQNGDPSNYGGYTQQHYGQHTQYGNQGSYQQPQRQYDSQINVHNLQAVHGSQANVNHQYMPNGMQVPNGNQTNINIQHQMYGSQASMNHQQMQHVYSNQSQSNKNQTNELSSSHYNSMQQAVYNPCYSLAGTQKVTVAVPRKHPSKQLSQPDFASNEKWTDTSFTKDIALKDKETQGVEWRRPSEIVKTSVKICLFENGAAKYDVGQGSVGTCWFLSMVAAIADKPHIVNKIFPNGEIDYDQEHGMFHCRLWNFGCWNDVYCDEFLPFRKGYGNRPWGAHSRTHDGEMWVPFLEKALAKYHGSYEVITGGMISDAFKCLTGGLTELVDHDKKNPVKFFDRAKNALASGGIVCSVCDKEGQGLIFHHAYTLTGAVKVPYGDGQVNLFRVRNPWGRVVNGKGEWTGPWSDGSSEWNTIDPRYKSHMQYDADDGEFWMSLEDFMLHYSQSIVCNVTPDFDRDGTSDGLDYVCALYGEWASSTAAGRDSKTILNNPLYKIVVPNTGNTENDIVLQLIIFRKNKGDKAKSVVKCHVSELETINDKYRRGKSITLEEKNYLEAWEKTDRIKLKPGAYVLIPATWDKGDENEFLLRIFSCAPISHVCELHRNQFVQ